MASTSIAAVNQGQCLAKTSSRCVAGSVTATHDFEVTNFSLLDGMGIGKFVSSCTFSVGGRDWEIRLYPDGCKEEDKASYVSVFLNLRRGPVGVRVKFSFRLLCVSFSLLHTFDCLGYWGWRKFVEKSKLIPLLQLSNDSFIVRCVVTVIKDPHSEDTSTIVVPQSNLPQHFKRLLKDGKGTDVTFSVDGQLFRAHRYVLAARSPVFDAELFSPMKQDATEHIQIDDMEPFVFESLLHFIYTDRIMLDDKDPIDKNVAMQHLLVAADRYGLDRLKMMCEAELCDDIDVETVGTALVLAEQHQCLHLKDACLTFVASKDVLGAVLETDGFKHFIESCPFIMQDI